MNAIFRIAVQVGWSQTRDGTSEIRAENKIDHNSLNFRARSPKFCMEVDLDRPQPFLNKKRKKRKKHKAQKTKLSITRSIFELEAQNFACK